MEIELDKTEQKIVDATIFLLDKKGMNGTTTKKIAINNTKGIIKINDNYSCWSWRK